MFFQFFVLIGIVFAISNDAFASKQNCNSTLGDPRHVVVHLLKLPSLARRVESFAREFARLDGGFFNANKLQKEVHPGHPLIVKYFKPLEDILSGKNLYVYLMNYLYPGHRWPEVCRKLGLKSPQAARVKPRSLYFLYLLQEKRKNPGKKLSLGEAVPIDHDLMIAVFDEAVPNLRARLKNYFPSVQVAQIQIDMIYESPEFSQNLELITFVFEILNKLRSDNAFDDAVAAFKDSNYRVLAPLIFDELKSLPRAVPESNPKEVGHSISLRIGALFQDLSDFEVEGKLLVDWTTFSARLLDIIEKSIFWKMNRRT